MALTFVADLLPYESYLRTGYIEGIDFTINILNAGSAGTIKLESELTTGFKKNEAFFKDFGKISRRDVTSDADQTAHKIERNEYTAFKTFWKFEPVQWSWTAFKTADNMSNEEVMYLVGKKLAEKKIEYTVNQAITIACAAIGSVASLNVDSSAKNISVMDILKAKQRFGDQAAKIKALVMHSSTYFTMVGDQMLNSKYTLGEGLAMYGGAPATAGLPVVVTDNPELIVSGEGANAIYRTLALTDSAVTLKDNGNTQFAMNTLTGKENIQTIFQGEGDMWNYVKGYQLKSTVGNNPDDTALSNSANWEQWTASKKDTAGVVIKALADLDKVQQVTYVKQITE
jgi:hypothetical protein